MLKEPEGGACEAKFSVQTTGETWRTHTESPRAEERIWFVRQPPLLCLFQQKKKKKETKQSETPDDDQKEMNERFCPRCARTKQETNRKQEVSTPITEPGGQRHHACKKKSFPAAFVCTWRRN